MDLVTKLNNPPASQPIGRSSIDVWADTLTVTEREAVYQAARNTDWGHVALRDLLAAEECGEVDREEDLHARQALRGRA